MRIGVDTPETQNLWQEKTLRGIRRNEKRRKELLENMREVWLKSDGGVILGKAAFILWDAPSHDSTIQRITRGLYYHHFGEILSLGVFVQPHYYAELDERMHQPAKKLAVHSIGDKRFVYAFGKAEDDPTVSVWLYQFYERHWAGAFTVPLHLKTLFE